MRFVVVTVEGGSPNKASRIEVSIEGWGFDYMSRRVGSRDMLSTVLLFTCFRLLLPPLVCFLRVLPPLEYILIYILVIYIYWYIETHLVFSE